MAKQNIMRNKKIQIFTILLLLVNIAFSQTARIKGFIYDKSDGEPVMFCNVMLKGTQLGVSTDIDGFYSISNVPAGKQIIVVSNLGYTTIEINVEVKEGEMVSKNLSIAKSSIVLQDIEISADKQENKTQVKTSLIKVTPKQIKQVPSVGGEPDLAQYIQTLPGVVFTGDQGGQLYIRGGSPIQNKLTMDGMIIYNPFHSIGLFSVFDSDIIKNADIYTGGFNAEYGGRISSIMDITMRDGNKKRFAGKVSVSPFGSKVLLEGPLKKQDISSNSGSASYIFSGKTSYLEQSSKLLYSYIDTAGLPFNYTDLYGKVSLNGASGSKINLFGFKFSDQVKYQHLTNMNWDTWGVGGNIVVVPSGSSVLIKANMAYSKYGITMGDSESYPKFSSIGGFNGGISFTYFMGKNELKYGIELLGFTTDYTFYNSLNRKLQDKQNTTEAAGYIKYKYTYGNLILEPSFRMHYYQSLSETSPEPRLGLKYNITENLRFKFAGGFYSQNLIAATSDQDVVNLFYGFLSGPEDLQSTFDGEEVTSRLQKARHAIAGVEYDLTNRISINLEGYYKQNTQLATLNRNKIYDDNQLNFDKPDYLKKDFIIEVGDAYGFDFVTKYDYKRLYVWAVYSLGYVTRFDGYKSYSPHYDRRHNVNLVVAYTFGEDLNWDFGLRWNLGSGFPFTQTQGFYEKIEFENINSNYTTSNGSMGIQYGDLNKGQLPYYHRLDISLKRKFEFSNNTTLLATASVTNAYNRENIFYFDRIEYKRVNQLPLMPSIGVSLTF